MCVLGDKGEAISERAVTGRREGTGGERGWEEPEAGR